MNKPTNGRYDKIAVVFWDNVDSVLRERGMTWRDLADRLNLNPRTLASKKSTRSNVSIGSAKEMAEAMGTSLDRLVYGNPDT